MTNIPVAITRILLHISNLAQIQTILSKKDESPSLDISEISDPEKGSYLNV